MKQIIDGVLAAFKDTNERLQPVYDSKYITPQAKGSMRGNMMQALLPHHLDGKETELADMEILGEPTELKVAKATSYPAANNNIFDSPEKPTRILIIRWDMIDDSPTVTEIRYGNHPKDFNDVWINHRGESPKMRDFKMKQEFYDGLEKIYTIHSK